MKRTRQLCFALLILVTLRGFSEEPAHDLVHELQRGETIYTLARRYGVSADVLLDYNSIADPTRLPVGVQIRIPGTYVVKEGEYIYSIARKLGVNWQDLLQLNGLGRNDIVRPGDVLLVPPGATAAADVPEVATTTAPDPTPASMTTIPASSAAVSSAAVSS
ncbi:MAG: LysM peptidoglycan-binding domain-containing protein, partial [Spirochaetaceae bacterium]|nr:LysM peptidoglycan-binding domain-containing protein [Spirochaetaceae bacterium]